MVSSTHGTHFLLLCARLVFLIVRKGRVKCGTKTKKACGRGFMGCPMPHLELSLGAGRRVQETSLKHHQGLQS